MPTEPHSAAPEWLPLAQAYFADEIGPEDFARLEALLLDSRRARDEFRRYANTDLALREWAEGESSGPAIAFEPAPASRPQRGIRHSLAWLQNAAMVAMAGGLLFLLLERQQAAAPPSGTVERPEFVQGGEYAADALAILTHAVGVEWMGKRAYAEGALLPRDLIEIKGGLLQIEFLSGATVVIEGPARFELIDSMQAVCELGRVRANVPHFARGFTILSDDLKVVDLGTEFGFASDANGVKELHVFDGEVTVEGGAVGAEPRHLLTGSGIRVGAEALDFIAPSDMAFPDAEQIASLASAAADEQHRAWLRYSEELKASEDVQVYYGFDNQLAWSRRLTNDKKMFADPLYGAIVGCRWAEGRWRGKAALEFKRGGDRVRISIPGEHDCFSMMAWVRIDGFDRELTSLMLSDGWAPGGLHWQFTHDGRIILAVKTSDGAGQYSTERVLHHHLSGEWIHLAVSYDADERIVRHYLNGSEVSRHAVQEHHTVSVPRGELGNWRPGGSPRGAIDLRNLNGRMDEFLFFSAALDSRRVLDIYNEGRPH